MLELIARLHNRRSKISIANANETDERMSVEDLEAAFAAPAFGEHQLVTV